MDNLVFHFEGKEYAIFDVLKAEEVGAILKMSEERSRRLRPLDAKSTRRYFEDTDSMIATILRRCFHMTDGQIASIDQMQRRKLGIAFILFVASANDRKSDGLRP